MGFFKKLGRGLSKAAKGVARGVKQVAKSKIGKVAIGLAAPAVGSLVATKAVGAVTRLANAPARRKLKAEKQQKISKALAMDIARPQLTMMSSRDTNGAKAMPGGSVISRPSKKSAAIARPGGAPMKASPAGSKFAGFLANVKSEQKTREMFARTRQAIAKEDAAQRRRGAQAQARAARAAASAAKKAARAQAAAEKKAARAAAKEAKGGTNLLTSALAGAVGIKAGKKVTKAKVTAAAGRKLQSAVRTTVRKSPGLGKAVPVVAGTSAILAAGGRALEAQRKREVAKAEKKMGRKLSDTERQAMMNKPVVNTFAGK